MSEEIFLNLSDEFFNDPPEYLENLDFSPPNFIIPHDDRLFIEGRGENHESQMGTTAYDDTSENNNQDTFEPVPSTSGINRQTQPHQQPADDSSMSSGASDDEASSTLDEFIYDEEDILEYHIKKLEQNNREFNQNRGINANDPDEQADILNDSRVRETVKKFKYLKVLRFRQEARFRRVLKKDFCRMQLLNVDSAKTFALAMNELCMLIRSGKKIFSQKILALKANFSIPAYAEGDFVGIRIKLTDKLNDDGIFITLRHPSQYSVALILDNFTRIAQSAREYYGTNNIEIYIDCVGDRD